MKNFLFFFLVTFAVFSANCAEARDIFGLKKLSLEIQDSLNASIDHARDAGLALEQQANADGQARIKQVDDLANNAIDKLNADVEHQDEIAQNFIYQFDRMRTDTIAQLSDLIDKVSCKVAVALTEQMSQSLGRLGRLVGTNQIVITSPVLFKGEKSILGYPIEKTFKMQVPFSSTYGEIEDYLINKRLFYSRDDTPIASVLQTYLLLTSLAERTGCLTGDKVGYATKAAYYAAKTIHWRNIVGDGVTVP